MRAGFLSALTLAVVAGCAAAGRQPENAAVIEPAFETAAAAGETQVKLGEKPSDPAEARARAVERAKTRLSEKLDIPVAEIELVSAKAATWSDSSLGCPQPDRMYAQVLVDGHEVVLEARGQEHELHVGPKSIVICEETKR
jgi:hypothetical protein